MQPYPGHLVKSMTLADGTPVTIRPIRPGDAKIEADFVRNLSNESRYFRFMDSLRELTPQMVSHFTQIDYDRHMALIVVTGTKGEQNEIAVARYVTTDCAVRCEFAIAVADAWQHMGLGTLLMRMLIDAARERGLRIMFGEVLATNHKMLNLVSRLGFTMDLDPLDPHLMRIEAQL